MRIPILHPITRLIVGGAQENTMYTAALLDPTRYDVEVLSGPQTGSEGSLIEEVRERGVPLTLMPEMVREVSFKNDLLALIKLTRLMRSKRYTIVHTHSSKAGVIGRLAAKFAGVPIIVHTVHGWSYHDQMSAGRRKMYVWLEKLAASLTNAMIVVAERDIEKGLREGIGRREQFHIIRSAIPLDEFNPDLVNREEIRQELGIPLDAPVLGNVGRFSLQKNPLDWVKVAQEVAQKLPGCYFLLVGDGPLRSDVEVALKDAGIAERTILTGLRRDVPRMMAAMDVFLLTSLWEGLPRVIPQAMVMGVPAVANLADGTTEAIEHGKTGYLCEPGNIQTMAQYCLDLLTQPETRKMMGIKGQEFARREFDVHHMVEQIAELYEDLIKKKMITL